MLRDLIYDFNFWRLWLFSCRRCSKLLIFVYFYHTPGQCLRVDSLIQWETDLLVAWGATQFCLYNQFSVSEGKNHNIILTLWTRSQTLNEFLMSIFWVTKQHFVRRSDVAVENGLWISLLRSRAISNTFNSKRLL